MQELSMSEYETSLINDNNIKLLETFKGAKLHHRMQCMTCNHIWSATPISKRQTFKKNGVSGCPECNMKRRDTTYATSRESNIASLRERGIEILTPGYDGRRHTVDEYTYSKILVRNTTCGHTFECTPTNLLARHVECGVCGPSKRAAPLTTWSKANSVKWQLTASEWQKYKAEVTALTEQVYKTHKHKINPKNLTRGKAGVEGAYHLDHLVPKRFCFDNNIPVEICAHQSNLQMVGWRENVGSRDHIKGTIPPLFLQYVDSGTKLSRYAEVLHAIIPTGTKFARVGETVATLYDDASNRAIYVLPIDKTFANQKIALGITKELNTLNVKYTILFEDELTDVSLLAAKLTHYTGRNVVERVHARTCVIRECTTTEKRDLLNRNHVQGNDVCQIAYGAYHGDKLLAVMTFSKPRVALGQKGTKDRTGVWELSRFCTDVNYRVPGIASKLLKHFQTHTNWKEIYSYADKRWSVGNMYHQLGFSLTSDNPPDYFYVVNGTRKHRWNYRKDVLRDKLESFDPTVTEYQNMVDHGFWRVWDCGTLKFTIINSSPLDTYAAFSDNF